MSSNKLPEEIYHEILIRLPVKSVLKSKSVCKSWYSQISNPNFVKSHLNQTKNNSSSNSRLLLGIGDDLHSIGYDSLVPSMDFEDSAVRMRYPFKLQIQCVRLFGSCDGLVFLWLYGCSVYSDDGEDILCAWNPATREYKNIPQSPSIHFNDICINGLVYDGKNDDYKFVIGADGLSELTTFVEIFSLRSNSWERILTPYWSTYGDWKTGVLVNGDLHWLAKGECGVCIVYLDISCGMPWFKEIQLPTVPNLEFLIVGVLEEGCLCVVSDNGDSVGLGRVQVWEMKVYGVRESWTKRYVITNERITKSVMVTEPGWKIIWSFKNGKIVFMDSHKLVLYDPKHRTAVERNLDRLAYFTSEANYVESLFSLNSDTYVGTELLEESTEDEESTEEDEESTEDEG
ncbi:F-box protein CPR1-like [Papaver somniferum]|uniref:F-box protein CPR1-like n=1 Tax=Papaver somniferum TaxID=3469 RepID=UPI000E6F9A7F|nr:F-box protein CPR1-like [Papaver somniferum]